MQIEKLIKMANAIGDFFSADPDRDIAVEGIKNHLLRAWEPRMRREIIDYCNKDGSGLTDSVKQAVLKLEA
ncbi:MAG: formate dehydrogenase subunit delta [Methylomicrobium sp.]